MLLIFTRLILSWRPCEIAFQVNDTALNVIVEIELENGIKGLGSAAASPHVIGNTVDSVFENLQHENLQAWIGHDIREFRVLRRQAALWYKDDSSALTAIDIALHDAFGKHLGIPVYQLYGADVSPRATSITIGISSVEETLREAREYAQMGFHVLKIKTGKSLDVDIERCAKVYEEFGADMVVRIDGNQGYSAEETIEFYRRTIDYGIELIEQPMPVGAENELRTLPAEIRAKVACDESLKNASSALDLASQPQACGIYNIKLMKCGGLTGAFEIATIAKAAQIDLFWGCYDESKISISAALHAAMVCPSTKYLDLDGAIFLETDVVSGGYRIEDGIMFPLDQPGFGCELN
ncbi:MAG: dipeptide epimerase [Bacteroidota bacterium]